MRLLLLAGLALAATLIMAPGQSAAEDIDIYAGNNSNAKSNILLVLNNSSDWSANATMPGCVVGTEVHSSFGTVGSGTVGGVEICGLYKAVTAIGATPSLVGKLNMGVMLYNPGSAAGGIFKFPAPPTNALPTLDAAGIGTLQSVLRGLTRTGDNTSNSDVGGTMQESWAYYTGGLGRSGRQYVPLTGDVCGKNFVIYIGISKQGQAPTDSVANTVRDLLYASIDASTSLDANEKIALKQPMTWAGGNDAYAKASGTQYWGDEWARFNYRNNNIITYTITLKDTHDNPDYTRYMQNMAEKGGGTPFVVENGDVNGLVQALLKIFNDVQAVNSVFAAASLPISVNAQGTFLNQIYFGMFRPDPQGLPRWAGNLKQYQFAVDKSVIPSRLYMADTRTNPTSGLPESAINSARTGFFSPNAISFWTGKNTATLPDSIDPTGILPKFGGTKGGFFINNPQGAGDGFDSPDGEIVEKGGVAQRIRMENLINNYAVTAGTASTSTVPGNPRRLYTCTSGAGATPDCTANSPLSQTPFATSNSDITDTLLGTGGAPINVTSLTRSENTATAVLASAFSPTLNAGQLVTLSGTAYPQYNGLVTATPLTSTSFSFPLSVLPPTTGSGTFTASTPGFAPGFPKPISIVRSGSDAIVTLTAHPFSVGNTVVISGAGTGFDKTVAITATTADTFTYPLTVSPGPATTLGTARKGTGTTFNITSIALGTPGAGPSFSATVTVVTNNNHGYADNDPGVVVAGVVPAAYNGTFTVINGNNAACPGPNAEKNKRFCYTISTTPGASATGSVNITGSLFDLSSVTRTNSCVGASPSPVATVTATTTSPHGMTGTATLDIHGGDSASALYTGSNISVTITGTNTFTYPITTDPPCSDTSSTKQAAIGGATKTQLINWVRGEDSIGDEQGPGESGINVRPSIHGDVLHSRPAVVNFGGSIGVVVFYGANDGTLRAVNGNQTASIGTVPPGGELWGFVAPEFFGTLLRQYLNTPVVKLNSTSAAILPAPQPKDYYFDGGIGVYQDVTLGKTWIFVTARRGGRIMYALDVTAPANPKFLWKIRSGSAVAAENTTGFGEMGQTWSTPKVALVKGYVDGSGNPKPVLIFGAGYDPAEDAEPPSGRSMGRGIFILDAETGAIVWQARGGGSANTCTGTPCQLLDMNYAIPSDVTLVDRVTSDGKGYIDRLYVGDLGGNVWRVDLEPSVGGHAPSNWRATKFASVGGLSTDTTRRKIFFAPDVVQTQNYDAVLFATGDREHPTRAHQSVNILNRMYMLKDTSVGVDACPLNASTGVATCTARPIVDNTTSAACVAATLPKKPSSCTEAVPTDLFNASEILPEVTGGSQTPFTPGPDYDQTGNGFYVNLLNLVPHRQSDGSNLYGPEVQSGEKSVNAPTTIGGNTFFGSNAPLPPDPAVCQPNLGTARGYSVNFVTGNSRFVIFDGGGLPPSPVSGLVTIDGETYPFLIGAGDATPGCVGADCTSSVGGQRPPIPIAPVRSRTYWYRDVGNR